MEAKIILAPLILSVLVMTTGGTNAQESLSEECPMDLYVLFDFSVSMKPYATNLLQKADAIGNELAAIAPDLMIGLGGFVEKPTIPFSSS